MRDTAHVPQPPINPASGHQISRQGLDQKCQFPDKFGHFWPKNPNFYWRKQKFWYPHNGKKHLGTLFALFFGQAKDKMGQNCQYLAKKDKKAYFGPNLAFLGQNS